MAERKAVSKKVRFEVFKRDSFKCQYCGRSAPDVTLQLEHILPVSKGGKNDILNLLTACLECNSGKSDTLLSDQSAISKQKAQADELNERRQQLEMMMKWKNELLKLNDEGVAQAEKYWLTLSNFRLTDKGREILRKAIKKFGLPEILEVMDIAHSQYDDMRVAFDKIGPIANVRQKTKSDPVYEIICIVRGVLRNKLSYVNHADLNGLVRDAIDSGHDRNSVITAAQSARSWTQFVNALTE